MMRELLFLLLLLSLVIERVALAFTPFEEVSLSQVSSSHRTFPSRCPRSFIMLVKKKSNHSSRFFVLSSILVVNQQMIRILQR